MDCIPEEISRSFPLFYVDCGVDCGVVVCSTVLFCFEHRFYRILLCFLANCSQLLVRSWFFFQESVLPDEEHPVSPSEEVGLISDQIDQDLNIIGTSSTKSFGLDALSH